VRPSKRDIVIATRRSRLAVTQSETVGQLLARLSPRVSMRLVTMESEGDKITDHPLAAFGGKGLFTRSIEQALLDGKADIAVHSFKDLPTEPTPGLVIAATLRRYPVNDVLIARDAERIEDLPKNAVVGTCSPRRAAQVLRIRGDLKIVAMRGNVESRLRKVLEEETVDATLLAAAGLMRLGLDQHAANIIPAEQVLPACAQAALAVQCRADDHVTLRRCMPLNDAATSVCVHAERQVVGELGADCHSPVAVYAEILAHDEMRIRARVLLPDGSRCVEAEATGPVRLNRKLCHQVAISLLDQGARQMLQEAAKMFTGVAEP
jgi:hydroxymethylbilane synthase